MLSASMSIFMAEKMRRLSTISATSGYFASVQQISGGDSSRGGRFRCDQGNGVELSVASF